jgi:hypothetical protein
MRIRVKAEVDVGEALINPLVDVVVVNIIIDVIDVADVAHVLNVRKNIDLHVEKKDLLDVDDNFLL